MLEGGLLFISILTDCWFEGLIWLMYVGSILKFMR